MTILTDLSFPRVEVVDGGQSVVVRVGAHGDALLFATSEEAYALRLAIGQAGWELEQAEMNRASALSRAAARRVNALRAEVNAETGTLPPPFTSSPAVTERRVVHIPVTEDDCAGGAA